MTFITQKDCIKDEVIGLGKSGYFILCPVLYLIRHILHLHQNSTVPTTLLFRCFHEDNTLRVTPPVISETLCNTVTFMEVESLVPLLDDVST